MYEDSAVAVVVPAYNEAGFVGDVIDTVPAYVDRVYVVDDCSTDDTWAEIRRHARSANAESDVEGVRSDDPETSLADRARDPPGDLSTGGDNAVADGGAAAHPVVVPIRHERNRGVGGAIKTGYRRALADEVDAVAVMAGDGQMDPDRLESLLEPVVDGRAGYAKGNRLSEGDSREMSAWRLFGNLTLTLLTKVASGYWGMMDPQNGYTVISREALEAVDLDRLYEGYGFTNDLLVALNTQSVRIADVSMPAVYGDERSHIRYRSFVPRLSWLLLRSFVRRLGRKYVLRDFHPLALLYALGAAASAVALAGLGAAAAARSNADSAGGRAMASLVLLVLSSLSVLLAMAFDREENAETVVRVE
ncbi:glycosyltransferase family 2 protein [Natrononativus amylolyticus]|uniref:glycosyltransferase family 2 protein n=1 Tax=Natrononativus amylolyticus TaxID=2963434 RepID=UPI0020CDEF0E|nr:glycosyltransferase family 2 protein [Natrononativus amylolyticus]